MSWSDRRAALAALAGLAGVAALASGGCGFQLRQPPRLPFGSIALVGFQVRSSLREALVSQLAQQVRVIDTPDRAEVVLHAIEDLRERSVVASTAAAQVRELRLRLKLIFRAETPGGRELIARAELLLTREFNYSESTALAKEYEERELFRDLETDLVAQVLRRLAAVKV